MKHAFTPLHTRTIGLLVALAALLVLNMTQAQSLGDYRSAGSGNWAAAGTWERHNGTSFIAAGIAPSSTDGVISIRSGHVVTSNAAVTADQVVIDAAGTLSLTTTATFTLADGAGTDLSVSGALTVGNATISNAGTLVVNSGGSILWTLGTLSGAGNCTVESGATATLSGTGTKTLGTSLNNNGTVNWSAGTFTGPGTMNNNAGGSWNISNPLVNQLQLNSVNSGTITYTGAGTFNPFGAFTFTNSGALNINSGTWEFPTASTHTGVINVAAGAVLRFVGGIASLNAGSSITGSGIVRITGGTVAQVPAFTINAHTVEMLGGAWNTTGGITVASGGSFTWSEGTIGGVGGVTVNSGVTITLIGTSKTLNTTVNNNGIANWSGSSIQGTGTWNNNAGSNWNITNPLPNQLQVNTVNSGTITYTGAGTFNPFGAFTFTNSSVLDINSGTWTFATPSTHTGVINVAAGAVLKFTGGIASLNAGSSITGSGIVRISGGTVQQVPAFTINAHTVEMLGGTWNTNGGITAASGGSFTWSGGAIGGAGGLTVNSGNTVPLSTAAGKTLNTLLSNSGTVNWSEGTFTGTGTMNNNSGGNWNITNTLTNQLQLNTVNNGTMTYTGGASFNPFGAFTFTNNGVHNINSGTWAFPITTVQTGTVNIATGAVLQITAPNSFGGTVNNNGTLSGTTTTFTGSTFTNNGSVTTSSLSFAGSALQNLVGSGTVNNLKINNASGMTIADTQSITTNLNFTLGNITLGNTDLPLDIAATITGGSSASYLATTGTGTLRRHVLNNATNVNFPVGTASSFLPATVQLTAGSTADDISVRVENGISSDYDANGNATGFPLATHAAQAAWHISEAVVGGSDATVQLQWNLADEGIGFTRANSSVMRFDGSAWDLGTLGAASGAGPFTRSRGGFTSFSPFSVGDDLVTGLDDAEMAVVQPVIFPVPAMDVITIVSSTHIRSARAFDAAGRAQLLPMLGNNRFDVQALATGVYVFEGLGANGMIRSRFVKE